jgi:thymidylate kinase
MLENKEKSSSGFLFVIEGPDGIGKSTIIAEIVAGLRGIGPQVEALSFPGKTPNTLGKHIYELHHDLERFSVANVDPGALQALHIAAHIDCIKREILPHLRNGRIVILDRFWWSTVAYGAANGVKADLLDAMVCLEGVAWEGRRPDMAFLIDRSHPFKSDIPEKMWKSVRANYGKLAGEQGKLHPLMVVRNNRTVADAVKVILAAMNRLIRKTPSLFDSSFEYPQEERVTRVKSSSPICPSDKRWFPTKVTPVFDTYWRFAAERQEIFFRRFRNCPEPFTDDPILKAYKFTNAYRASDRVSQFLIRHVIYTGDQNPDELFFRIILFKTFNKISTWQLLQSKLGSIVFRDFKFSSYDKILTETMQQRQSIYSGAYIMPSGGNAFGYPEKHRNHLRLIELMMKEEVPRRVCKARSLQEIFLMLRGYPMIGDFLAFQYTIDLNYSEMIDFKEMSFVVPGPGAKDGIRKCFSDFGGLSEVDLIHLMADRQEGEFAQRNLKFQNLWGRPLQLIDCQNLFCEVDKYSRVAHPEVAGLTGRTKIKQKFHTSHEPIDYFYPPKWNLNETIQKASQSVAKSENGRWQDDCGREVHTL